MFGGGFLQFLAQDEWRHKFFWAAATAFNYWFWQRDTDNDDDPRKPRRAGWSFQLDLNRRRALPES